MHPTLIKAGGPKRLAERLLVAIKLRLKERNITPEELTASLCQRTGGRMYHPLEYVFDHPSEFTFEHYVLLCGTLEISDYEHLLPLEPGETELDRNSLFNQWAHVNS